MPTENNSERGWALVSVLWAVSLLAMLAVAAQTLALSSYKFEKRMLANDRLDAAFEAGIARAVFAIGDPDEAKRWPVDGTEQPFAFDGTTMRIAIQAELGRIDLNAADGSFIQRLLLATGLKADDAEALTDCILDWRSTDRELKRLHGGNDADYEAAGKPYRPRHGPFQRVDELKLVLGMTPELFAKLQPALTVYSKRPMVDPQLASPLVLRALYADEAAADMQIRTRSQSPTHMSAAIPLGGRTFDIALNVERNGRVRQRGAVIMLTNDPKRPYLVLSWR